MTDTFRALCAELADSVELLLEMRSNDRPMRVTEDRLNRARAALEAQPEPQGPSELELEAIELKLWDKHRTKGCRGEEFMYDNDFSAALDEYRDLLAQPEPQPPAELAEMVKRLHEINNPTPQPVSVSERLPGPEDCDVDGCCWWWNDEWRLSEHRLPWRTHWLPHGALPVPANQEYYELLQPTTMTSGSVV
jgi:hypothetical protein